MVIEVCPKCGKELEYTTITTNPPIHVTACKSCGWKKEDRETIEYVPYGYFSDTPKQTIVQSTPSTKNIRQGWQCPICKRVYSPDTSMCTFCDGDTVITCNTLSGTYVATTDILKGKTNVVTNKTGHDPNDRMD